MLPISRNSISHPPFGFTLTKVALVPSTPTAFNAAWIFVAVARVLAPMLIDAVVFGRPLTGSVTWSLNVPVAGTPDTVSVRVSFWTSWTTLSRTALTAPTGVAPTWETFASVRAVSTIGRTSPTVVAANVTIKPVAIFPVTVTEPAPSAPLSEVCRSAA